MPGYDIPLRALFYCCRMVSAQQGVEFSTDADDLIKYGNIKKVYSIWICTDTAQKRANSIEKYEINRSMLVWSNTDSPRYDIMNAIIINISGKQDSINSDNGLILMLTDLFDERIDGVGKIEKLKEYGLSLTKEVESTWRAPNLNGIPVFIKYRPQRILCPEHGALNEFIPWAENPKTNKKSLRVKK